MLNTVRLRLSYTGCCVHAASGHPAAPPRVTMNSRRYYRLYQLLDQHGAANGWSCQAFEAQRSAIGLDAAAVYVPHPMQNRTTAELHTFAEQSIDAVFAAICLSYSAP